MCDTVGPYQGKISWKDFAINIKHVCIMKLRQGKRRLCTLPIQLTQKMNSMHGPLESESAAGTALGQGERKCKQLEERVILECGIQPLSPGSKEKRQAKPT